MKINNAVIITEIGKPILMKIEELKDFSGNSVFCRSEISSKMNLALEDLAGRLGKCDSAPADTRRSAMKQELVD